MFLEIGYNSAQFHHGQRRDEELINECVKYGMLTPTQSKTKAGNTVYTVTAMNERQQITSATFGSVLIGDFGFDAYGYPAHSKAFENGTAKQDYRYVFDPVTGNLSSRQNLLRSKSESFGYDNLERLETVTGPQNLSMAYAANGNILTKSDVGTNTFQYNHPLKPYALTDLESSTGVIPDVLQDITYTSFEQPWVKPYSLQQQDSMQQQNVQALNLPRNQ
ncbi:MAG TPA: hypothetical protein VKY57_00175 [Chitinispirillaceae bacterium]|nr:hypothetical protein [Chitinispirillaceae bacterium]